MQKLPPKMAEGQKMVVHSMKKGRRHGMNMLHGISRMKTDQVLCDVTLIAEGTSFPAHRLILASASDFFRTLFTSGMRESSRKEIELKGITARGLEKTLDYIYNSTMTLFDDDIFDVIAAAHFLLVTPVVTFCESIFLSGMTTSNFDDFSHTAKLYSLKEVLKQIDVFIANNLNNIAREGTLHLLTYDQMWSCLDSGKLCLREKTIFHITWEWLRQQDDTGMGEQASALMRLIRFPLISTADLVQHVQRVDLVMSNPELKQMVLAALKYHTVPHSQPLLTSLSTRPRSYVTRQVIVGGLELEPIPHVVDDILAFDAKITSYSLMNRLRQEMAALPSALCLMQVVVFNNFLYVLGGCPTTQCAHGESAVNSVLRYDPRFDSWFQVCPMKDRRSYFFAGALHNKIYAVGGQFNNGSLATAECYDLASNTWDLIAPLPRSYHGLAGAMFGDYMYTSGGCSGKLVTPDVLRYDPVNNRWEEMSDMVCPRDGHKMVATHDKLFVLGGLNELDMEVHPDMECYNPATDQWTLVSKSDSPSGLWERVGIVSYSLCGSGQGTLELPCCSPDDEE